MELYGRAVIQKHFLSKKNAQILFWKTPKNAFNLQRQLPAVMYSRVSVTVSQ